jgi:hypothetical protein
MSDRDIQIERMLEGETGRFYIGPDRVQTRAALKGVLADLAETEFARLADAERCVQVMAPVCGRFFEVGTHRIILTGAGTGEKVEVHTEFVYLSPLLEHLSPSEVHLYVAQALTLALERLAGHSDIAALQIAGLLGAGSPPGGASRPN